MVELLTSPAAACPLIINLDYSIAAILFCQGFCSLLFRALHAHICFPIILVIIRFTPPSSNMIHVILRFYSRLPARL